MYRFTDQMFSAGYGMMGGFYGFLVPIMILDLVLRGFALWRSARANQQWWFIALLVVNSMGILPGIYLLMHPLPTAAAKSAPKAPARKASKARK